MNKFQINVLYLCKSFDTVPLIQKGLKKTGNFPLSLIPDYKSWPMTDFAPSLIIIDLDEGAYALLKNLKNAFSLASFLIVVDDNYNKENLEITLGTAPLARDFVQINGRVPELKMRVESLLDAWFETVNSNKIYFDATAPVLATLDPTSRLTEQGDWLCIWAARSGWNNLEALLRLRLLGQYPNTKSGFSSAIANLEKTANLLNMNLCISEYADKKFKNE